MIKNLRKFALLFILLGLSFVVACSKGDSKAEAKSTTVSNVKSGGAKGTTPAYNFTLTGLDGKKVTLADFKGKALIVDVWDTWCPPCKAEIPHFIELYKEYHSKGLEILGVAGGRYGKAAVEKFIKDYGINYNNAIIDQAFNQGFGGIYNIPTTFVIDTDGNIYKKYIGYNDKSIFESDIKAILNL